MSVSEKAMAEKIKHLLERILLSKDHRNKYAHVTVTFARFLFYTWKQLIKERCLEKAAALSFVTILTLIPVTVLFFLMFNVFIGLDSLRIQVERFLFHRLLADSVAQVSSYLTEILRNLNASAIGWIGMAALLSAAYAMFKTVDRIVNDLWHTTVRRGFARRVANVWTLLTLVPLLLGVSLYISTHLQQIKSGPAEIHTLAKFFYRISPFLFTFAALFLLNTSVPMTKVKKLPAATGSLISALLWEGSKSLFNFYVWNLFSKNHIYGSLGLLPVFLLWVYITWLIVLFGVMITYTMQNLRGLHDEELRQRMEKEEPGKILLGMHTIFEIILTAVRTHTQGKPPLNKQEIIEHTDLPPELVHTAVEALERTGLIACVEDENGEEKILPATNLLKKSAGELILKTFKTAGSAPPEAATYVKRILSEDKILLKEILK